jgi:hypothetical protein
LWYFLRGEDKIGPLALSQMTAAMKVGDLNPSDLVWTAGMDSWETAGSIAWLSISPTPLPLPPNDPSKNLGDDAMLRWVIPIGRSGWALASGYLGLLVFIPFVAPAAAITGVLAIRDIRRREIHGMGRAVFGIVMGAIGIGVYAAIWMPAILSS